MRPGPDAATTHITDLPHEVVGMVYLHLGKEDRINFLKTCKQWLCSPSILKQHIRRLELWGSDTNGSAGNLTTFQPEGAIIRCLHIRLPETPLLSSVSSSVFFHKSLTNVTEVRIEGHCVTSNELDVMGRAFPQLRKLACALDFSFSNAQGNYQPLARLKSLQELVVPHLLVLSDLYTHRLYSPTVRHVVCDEAYVADLDADSSTYREVFPALEPEGGLSIGGIELFTATSENAWEWAKEIREMPGQGKARFCPGFMHLRPVFTLAGVDIGGDVPIITSWYNLYGDERLGKGVGDACVRCVEQLLQDGMAAQTPRVVCLNLRTLFLTQGMVSLLSRHFVHVSRLHVGMHCLFQDNTVLASLVLNMPALKEMEVIGDVRSFGGSSGYIAKRDCAAFARDIRRGSGRGSVNICFK